MSKRGDGGTRKAAPAAAHDRRSTIVDAALDLFGRSGFHGTSVRNIAQAVGVNEATLYHYFPSKAALLDAIIDREIAERRRVALAVDLDRPLADILLWLASQVLEAGQSSRARSLTRLMMLEGPRLAVQGRYPFLRLFRDGVTRLRRLFGTLIAAGKMRRIDTRLAGIEFIAPILVYAQHQHGLGGAKEEPLDPGTFVRSHVDVFLRAFAPPEGDRARSARRPRRK